jgi:adenine-specific DNA-methyltransferase
VVVSPFNYLMVDTTLFGIDFKARLLQAVDNLDDVVDGVLVHGDNFQGLSLLQERYKEQVKCIYIDPPYNTMLRVRFFIKMDYKNSSWLAMIDGRIEIGNNLLNTDKGVLCCTIDDFEHKYVGILIESYFESLAGTVSIRIKPSGRPIPNNFAISHEYALFAKKNPDHQIARLVRSDEQLARYREHDSKGRFEWEMLRKAGF